ncbi:MAG: enoyl-CoA hydratase-related protein [Alphaproteobacteria bacterium]|jgi:enoyl-CoA hydratase/carnithine racemase|nr:enoyl-CoA hydratase [Rhodospirillaceae bacterium]MDP6023465.1 enoyl-CoA hydratase-related protein [Alphaproteobacteria bacterium]MDP6256820.1 enoyl-CoA hydratase-related protein [Alphaproteobacteria bacterium]MDP7056053.1 enoyl-CoA hydratase-related protein [Alphaproteobacteria bacterium]MDP7229153.1 enoyl-CoA hydratase-related protein [Alphaproteobacteria bacterium]|tara:strand:+ start:3721 stop:4488 length:768 start_codon:yes stop_codon:yes gene_type:complete
MSESPVRYELSEGIATITIDRPEAMNALNKAVREGLWDALRRFAGDDEALVGILTATGEKVFCAGGDLKEMSETALKVPPPDFVPYLNHNIKTNKPVIAAVNGLAYAGGFLLAQMCDLVIAAENAKFAITEPKWSRGAPWAAPLPWLIPPRVAMELLVTAKPISAARAYQIGLINQIVPLAELQDAARDMALTIAQNAPLSVRAGKQMVYAVAEVGWSKGQKLGDKIYEHVYLSEDAQEGPTAFKEKRAPVWKAR